MTFAMMLAQWMNKQGSNNDGKENNKRSVELACEVVFQLNTNQLKNLNKAINIR